MSAQEKTRDALYDAIATRLATRQKDEDKVLTELATAYAEITYGPQGGAIVRRNVEDSHSTSHEGDRRSAPPGFTSLAEAQGRGEAVRPDR